MNRKEFLRTSGLLLPLSYLGMPRMKAAEARQNPTPTAYLESEAYQRHANALRFRADKTFKIVQFTDVHWVPDNTASQVASDRMNEVLDAEKPDLVVYTGDLVFGKPAEEALRQSLAPTIDRSLPFLVALGNHDDEQDMSRREIYEYLEKQPDNLTGTVEGISGVTNGILPVRTADGSKEAALLYVFDSLAYSHETETKGYDWIKHDQIEWYRQCSATLTAQNGGKPLPALAFFHIPLPEYNLAASDESTLLIGVRKERACAPVVNSGLFTAILEAGDIMGIFVGHDHVNDYVAKWKGILLGYGRYTGGKTVYHDIPWGNGARVIQLTEGERSFRSWIRLSEGRVITQIDYPKDFIKED